MSSGGVQKLVKRMTLRFRTFPAAYILRLLAVISPTSAESNLEKQSINLLTEQSDVNGSFLASRL